MTTATPVKDWYATATNTPRYTYRYSSGEFTAGTVTLGTSSSKLTVTLAAGSETASADSSSRRYVYLAPGCTLEDIHIMGMKSVDIEGSFNNAVNSVNWDLWVYDSTGEKIGAVSVTASGLYSNALIRKIYMCDNDIHASWDRMHLIRQN